VTYRGSEVSIDGGTGTNTLVLATAATVNLANADQTSADLVTVTNFQNVDASALSTGVAITGTSSANTITGGTGADSIDGAGGADVLSGGAGDDSVAYYGTDELDRRRYRHQYADAARGCDSQSGQCRRYDG